MKKLSRINISSTEESILVMDLVFEEKERMLVNDREANVDFGQTRYTAEIRSSSQPEEVAQQLIKLGNYILDKH